MKSVFVGNINSEMPPKLLRELFAPFGEVLEVRMMPKTDCNKRRVYGFVDMAEEEAAGKAIAGLNGKMVMERELTVREAEPKPERSDPKSEAKPFQAMQRTPITRRPARGSRDTAPYGWSSVLG